jgi:hypothetical protein
MYIFIDDERVPDDVTWVKLPKPDKWDVCRSYNGFVKLLESLNKAPVFVSFDHDLGHKPTGQESEKTGHSCAKALIEICIQKNWPLPIYTVHSKNTVGRENIIQTLKWGQKWANISSGSDGRGINPQPGK